MEYILGKVTQQAMNYAIRSGVTLTASYAIKQSSKLLQNAPKSNATDALYELQQRLQHKIKIISPAIDLIELIAARGNTSLESAVSLTKELRLEIQNLGQRLARAAASSEEYRHGSSRNMATLKAKNEDEMKVIITEIKKLLTRIEDAVPLINLALTTSGAKLSTQLPSTVSPSRLLQASTFLTAGDTQYTLSPDRVAQVGPTFTLSVYMLFAGHDRPETEEDVRNTTWKEVMHKAQVRLRRVPLDVVLSTGSGSDALQSHEISASLSKPRQDETPSQVRAEARSDEFAYQLMVVEDYDDDRHHDFDAEDAKPMPFDNVRMAGVREMIPVHEISKIFYADTSKVLNIDMDAEANNPVLLLRRDVHAVAPRRMVEQEPTTGGMHMLGDGQANEVYSRIQENKDYVQRNHKEHDRDPWRLPPSLDPEWIAFEVYTEAEDSASDVHAGEDDDNHDFETSREEPETSELSVTMSAMRINSPLSSMSPSGDSTAGVQQPWVPKIKTSLSMLELLLRLTSLQQFQQQSHLSIPDELLNFFLEESASTGAGGDERHRQAIRADARRRVGWDPYNESPLKRRGEDYQYGQQPHYESPRSYQQYQYSYDGSIVSPSYRPDAPSPAVRQSFRDHGGGVSFGDAPSTSISASQRGVRLLTPESSNKQQAEPVKRSEWLRRQQDTPIRGSPLNPTLVHRDEGIGTSPGTSSLPENSDR